MRKLLVFIIASGYLFQCVANSWGFPLPKAHPLPQTIGNAEVIAIFKIDSLDLKAKPVPKPTGKFGFTGTEAFIALVTFEGEGTYGLTTIKNIKGDVGASVRLNLPSLTGLGYSSTFHVKVGDYLVALLRMSDDGWIPQDSMRPFVPLFPAPNLTSLPDGDPLQQVESLIVPELKSKATRLMAVSLLSYSTNPQVLVALAPYIEDSDLGLRDSILTTFARNRQLGAINRIRDLNRLTSIQNSNARSISELRNYGGMKEAVPLLNPLLFEDEQFMRINVLESLVQVKDMSSIPFLLLTLYDPEQQRVNAPGAYAMFVQTSGAKLNVGAGDFALHPDQARKEAWAWWRDELAGKHPHANDKERIELKTGQTHDAKDLPQLNEALFMRSEKTRRAAIEALDKLADQSSVPYLIVALHDLQGDVAYGAHRILTRLVPDLGPVLPRNEFNARQEQLAEAGAQWWSKHLQDAEEARRQAYTRQLEVKPTRQK